MPSLWSGIYAFFHWFFVGGELRIVLFIIMCLAIGGICKEIYGEWKRMKMPRKLSPGSRPTMKRR
jgi:hypothetical protein